MSSPCFVLISAPNKREAELISNRLVGKKLVAGVLIIRGISKYWWKKRIVEKKYYNIQAFSLFENKRRIIFEVERVHTDECPIVAFFRIDGNSRFLDWIRRSVK